VTEDAVTTSPGWSTTTTAKLTGAAVFGSDVGSANDLHAVPVLHHGPPGTLRGVDAAAALAVPGARAVLTSEHFADAVGAGTFLYDGGQFHSSFAPMGSREVRFSGQLVALVVATTPEAARSAAALVHIEVAATLSRATVPLSTREDALIFERVVDPPSEVPTSSGSTCVARAYETAPHFHHALEPYSMRAEWARDGLTVHHGSQWVVGEAHGIAQALGVAPEGVRVVSAHVGGAFGSRALLMWHVVYVAAAAKMLGQPLRLHVDRSVMATLGSFRPSTRHDVELEVGADLELLRYRHHVRVQNSRSDVVPLRGLEYASELYACASSELRESVVRCDVPTPGFMRAPGEYPVAFALESALDELAHACGADPVELRLRNLAPRDPGRGGGPVHLGWCLERGAELFGWAGRPAPPSSMRDQATGELLGWGMAVAHYPAYGGGVTECQVSMDRRGRVTVELAAHDPGTGLTAAVAHAVARELECSAVEVDVVLGDSDLPLSPMAAGSASTRTAVAAAVDAARKVRRMSASRSDGSTLVATGRHVPLGMTEAGLRDAAAGRFAQAGAAVAGEGSPLRLSVGAHFVEVAVDPARGRISVRRMVGVFDVGTVLEPQALKSQLEGGMIWGAGHALMEDAALDPRSGRFLGAGLADYHMMVQADVPLLEVEVLGETDPGSVGGPKGAGELGVVGSSAAVTNAIHHATGVRVRQLPVRSAAVMAACSGA
jgi:xanthine dehydrogenase YagR molybdenum-binding subunit